MRFVITRTSLEQRNRAEKPCEWAKWDPALANWTIEILELGDLRALQRDTDSPIIIDGDTLEIYDGHRE